MSFVQISRRGVRGYQNKPPSDEDTAYSPQNPYAATKAAADHLIHSWVNTYNIDAVLARSCNVGPRQNIEKFIPKVILQISKQLPITLYDDGLNIRQWIHVKDCCMAIFKIMKYGRRGKSYNIGTMNCLRNIDLLENLMFLTKGGAMKGFKFNY